MFGRMNKYRTMYVSTSLKEGDEFERNGKIFKVKAITGERTHFSYGGGWSESIIVSEYQCTVVERLQEEIKELKVAISELQDTDKVLLLGDDKK
jgi:hypothetical protein